MTELNRLVRSIPDASMIIADVFMSSHRMRCRDRCRTAAVPRTSRDESTQILESDVAEFAAQDWGHDFPRAFRRN